MSEEANQAMRLDANPNLKSVLDRWTEALAEVFESMAGQRPEINWRAASGDLGEVGVPTGPGAEQEVLWWEQPFQFVPDTVLWVAAPSATWEYAGRLTLRAAGLEVMEPAEVQSTWFELLGQSLGVMARNIGALASREVTLAPGVERAPDADMREWASVTLNFPDAALAPVVVAMSPQLSQAISHPVPLENERLEPQAEAGDPAVHPAPPSQTLDLLLDVDLPVSISFGKTSLPLKDVLKLTTGSIVELNRGVNDHVEVLVNHCLIARGEVVVVEGNYGVRIQEVVKRHERLRSFQ